MRKRLEKINLEELKMHEKVELSRLYEKNLKHINTILSSIDETGEDANFVVKVLPSVYINSEIETKLDLIQTKLIILELNEVANTSERILKIIDKNNTTRKIEFNPKFTEEDVRKYFLESTKSLVLDELKDKYYQAYRVYTDCGFTQKIMLESHKAQIVEETEKVKKNKFFDLFNLRKDNTKDKEVLVSIQGNVSITLESGTIYSAIYSGLSSYYWMLKTNYFLY